MPRQFEVPNFYRSPSISAVKRFRLSSDPKKRDLAPTIIDFGVLQLKIARHFGFCFGVENAIEIAYRTIAENASRRIFLVSEMIHNPEVNQDLINRGVRFLLDTSGKTLIPLDSLTKEDVVIVPAFGTTIELQKELEHRGINPYYYDTTCPFVEKVWKRAEDLGRTGHTVIIHGKRTHEETRATFSHSIRTAPTLVIFDLEDAHFLGDFIEGKQSLDSFVQRFTDSVSQGFDPIIHLKKVGVINQTTMLATETQEIANVIRKSLVKKYGEENIKNHFADTRDTLCYATYENQSATKALIGSGIDIAIVVGGYNSSNTSHLVELCEIKVPTFYIKDAGEIIDRSQIRHFDLKTKTLIQTTDWLPELGHLRIGLTSGASCPDRLVDEVLAKVVSFFPAAVSLDRAFDKFLSI